MPYKTCIKLDSLTFTFLTQTIYYILSLTINIVLAKKPVGFSKIRQILRNIFAMHYGDTKD